MMIIKKATPEVARQASIRSLLTRIDVDREANTYDIYFDGQYGIQLDYLTIYNQRYCNVRIHGRKANLGSFQINLSQCEKIVIL